jgi:hypothetical protein
MQAIGKRMFIGSLISAGIALCAHGFYAGYAAHEGAAEFSWIPASEHRRAGFGLILNAGLWPRVTGRHGRGAVIIDAQAQNRLSALIEQAMQSETDGCSGRWLLSNILPLPDGGIFFSGFCATDAELNKARGEAYAKVRT